MKPRLSTRYASEGFEQETADFMAEQLNGSILARLNIKLAEQI